MVSRKRVQSFSKKYGTLWYMELVKNFNFLDKKSGFAKTIKLCAAPSVLELACDTRVLWNVSDIVFGLPRSFDRLMPNVI